MSEKSEEANARQNKKISKIIAIICVIIIVAAALVVLLRDKTEAPSASTEKPSGVSMYVSPDAQTLSRGQELSLSVWANSDEEKVNAVEADINYPTDYFSFEKVDDTTSSFPLAVQADEKDGKITIVRGTTTPIQGNNLIAVVKLQIKDKSGRARISFTKDSKLFGSSSNKDILKSTKTGTYTIK